MRIEWIFPSTSQKFSNDVFLEREGRGRLTKNLPRFLPRILIGIVLALNLECASLFLFSPDRFVDGFEISGVGGQAAVQGMGLLFLMWNVAYIFACIHPVRYRICLLMAILMQAIGLVGETWLLFSLPKGHNALYDTGVRFILFDAPGLLLLCVAWMMTRVRPNL